MEMNSEWLAFNQELLNLLETPPPRNRRAIYAWQIKNDFYNRSIIVSLLIVIAPLVIGIVFHYALLRTYGALFILIYPPVFLGVTSAYIKAPLVDGLISSIGEPHPNKKHFSATKAKLDSGDLIPVSVLTEPARRMFEDNDVIRAKILFTKKGEYSKVMAIRAQ